MTTRPAEGCHYWIRSALDHSLQVVCFKNGEFWAIGIPFPVEVDTRWIVARIVEPGN